MPCKRLHHHASACTLQSDAAASPVSLAFSHTKYGPPFPLGPRPAFSISPLARFLMFAYVFCISQSNFSIFSTQKHGQFSAFFIWTSLIIIFHSSSWHMFHTRHNGGKRYTLIWRSDLRRTGRSNDLTSTDKVYWAIGYVRMPGCWMNEKGSWINGLYFTSFVRKGIGSTNRRENLRDDLDRWL